MELFRKLAGNFFFKIVLAFVILTFVLFGVSGFILGQNDNYVAKIGDKVVSYNEYIESARIDREIIRSSTNSKEALRYLESNAFKSDVIGRLINAKIAEILADEYGFIPSRDLILQEIVKSSEFHDENAKFDETLFNNFLTKHSLSEEKYLDAIINEVLTSGVIQSFAIVAPVNKFEITALANLSKQVRRVNLVEIDKKLAKNVKYPKQEELVEFYEANKANYKIKELRSVEILKIAKKDLETNFEPTLDEVKKRFEENKDKFNLPENREFLHVVFEEKKQGQEFLRNLNNSKNEDLKSAFIKEAKASLDKNLDDIKLSEITKEGLLPSIASDVFKLKIGQLSNLLKSELGYHLFLTTNIKQESSANFDDIKESIRTDLRNEKRQNIVETNISKINDIILQSNSLEQVIKDLSLKTKLIKVTLNEDGLDKNGRDIKQINNLGDFSQNVFALGVDKVSKIYYTKNYDGFYLFKVREIVEESYKDLATIKKIIGRDLLAKKRSEKLSNLANKIAEEIKKDPKNIAKIARKNGAKYYYKKSFNLDEEDQLSKNIFDLNIGESTTAIKDEKGNYKIALLNKIIAKKASSKEIEDYKIKSIQGMRQKILRKYNEYISQKYPIAINQKIFAE